MANQTANHGREGLQVGHEGTGDGLRDPENHIEHAVELCSLVLRDLLIFGRFYELEVCTNNTAQ